MSRVTKQQLESAFEAYARVYTALGLDATRLALYEGSQTYARAYRVWEVDPQSKGLSAALGTSDGYLGWTRSEAYESLSTMARMYQDVVEVQRGVRN